MKICHVITRLIVGGAQENTILTCRGLVERGHEVTLVAGPETGAEGSLWREAETSGCTLVMLDALRRAVRPGSDVRAAIALRRTFRELRPDVVHTHSSKAGILGRWAAHAAGVAVIVHTIHGMSFNRTQPAIVRATYRALERRAARWTTRFVTVADAMIDQAVTAGLAPRERFVTIRSGMETDRFRPDPAARREVRGQWGVAEDDVVVGTIARLFRNKGYEELLPALPGTVAQVPKARFVWVGNGAQRGRYEKRLAELGLRDRVVLTGLVRPEEIPRLMNGFDVLVHGSRWEGLPRAVVQAQLCGVPAIAFDLDGAPEVIVSGETGLLVRADDAMGLADAIVRLASDAGLRKRCGEAGRARCLPDYDWRTMVERLDRLYAELVR